VFIYATFRQRLKTFLLQQSFPDIIISNYVIVDFEMAIAVATLKLSD